MFPGSSLICLLPPTVLLQQAEKELREFKDEYIAVEHLIARLTCFKR